MKGGLILEPLKFSDYSHEQVFGAAPSSIEIVPLDRDTSGIPVVFQGQENTCVSCSITWVLQWMDKEHPNLSHEWLAFISRTEQNGATVSQVLEPARRTGVVKETTWKAYNVTETFEDALQDAVEHQLPGYFFLSDLSPAGIYSALKKSPVLIGVKEYMGVGPHMMVAYDVTADQHLKCKNWWDEATQSEAVIPFESVIKAVGITKKPEGFIKEAAQFDIWDVILDKIIFYFKKYVF